MPIFKNTTAIGGRGPTGLNPAYHAAENYLDAYAIAPDKSMHVGNLENTVGSFEDCAEPAAGDTRDVDSSDCTALGYDVTAYHVVELYNDNSTVDLELPSRMNAEGMPCSPEVARKHGTCHYYASMDEAHGDSVPDDLVGPMEYMLHYLLSLHSLMKVLLDTSACVRMCMHGTCVMTLNRLNNHGLH